MSLEDTIGSQDEVPSCVVCGKNVTKGGGFARINHKGTMVNCDEQDAHDMARLSDGHVRCCAPQNAPRQYTLTVARNPQEPS